MTQPSRTAMSNCEVCHRPLCEAPLVVLRDMPAVAQRFPDAAGIASDHGVALDVRQCTGCGLVQLVCEPVPYHRDVIRAAAVSSEMKEFRAHQFAGFLERFRLKGARLVEIGCGRGEYLQMMQSAGAVVAGLENAAASVEEARRAGFQVEQGYVESEDFKISGAPFDGFFVLNFLEHVPDIYSFLRGIAINLVRYGVGLVEVPNFDMMVREGMVSEFMTDHLYYFNADTLNVALRLNGFEVLECKPVWHEYILSAVVRRRAPVSPDAFLDARDRTQKAIDEFLTRFPDLSVAIWGAGHQALASIALYKLKDRVAYVVDSAPFKQGRFTPASHLPVKSPETLKNDPSVKAVLVMGASYSDEIAARVIGEFNLPVAILRPHGLEIPKA